MAYYRQRLGGLYCRADAVRRSRRIQRDHLTHGPGAKEGSGHLYSSAREDCRKGVLGCRPSQLLTRMAGVMAVSLLRLPSTRSRSVRALPTAETSLCWGSSPSIVAVKVPCGVKYCPRGASASLRHGAESSQIRECPGASRRMSRRPDSVSVKLPPIPRARWHEEAHPVTARMAPP